MVDRGVGVMEMSTAAMVWLLVVAPVQAAAMLTWAGAAAVSGPLATRRRKRVCSVACHHCHLDGRRPTPQYRVAAHDHLCHPMPGPFAASAAPL